MKTRLNLITKTNIAAALLALSTNSYGQELQFVIHDIRSNHGSIYIRIFQGEENYNASNVTAQNVIPVTKKNMMISFKDLKPGEYVVSYFHDEDADGKLATNMFGIPTEGYGFSNNAQGSFGPPNYQEMKFTVTEQDKITINQSSVIY